MSAKDGSNRRLKPIITVWSTSLICSQQASTRAMSRSIGFSHRTALPASTAREIRSTWVGVGDPMTTASIVSSASTASTSEVATAPCFSAS